MASYIYYSGKLPALKALRVRQGGLPWRILRYERIIEPEELHYPVAKSSYIRPKSFEAQLQYLSTECTVLPLMTLLEKLKSGDDLPLNPVALTFDCGYLETYERAFPLLRRYGLPATVFAPTAFVGSMNMFWDDKLLASLLALGAAGESLPRFSFFSDEENRALDVLSPKGDITLEAAEYLVEMVTALGEEEQMVMIGYIGQRLEDYGGMPMKRAFVNWDEMRRMAAEGVTFGTMGHAHLMLPDLAPEEMAADLHKSFTTSREQGLEPLPVASFPQGAVDERVMRTLGSLGLHLGVAVGLDRMDLSLESFRLYGRLPIYQDSTFCKELFACYLWDIEAYGMHY